MKFCRGNVEESRQRGLVAGALDLAWTCNLEVPRSNPPPCHWMGLCSVVLNSTPAHFVNSQLVSLLPVGIFDKFLFDLQYS